MPDPIIMPTIIATPWNSVICFFISTFSVLTSTSFPTFSPSAPILDFTNFSSLCRYIYLYGVRVYNRLNAVLLIIIVVPYCLQNFSLTAYQVNIAWLYVNRVKNFDLICLQFCCQAASFYPLTSKSQTIKLRNIFKPLFVSILLYPIAFLFIYPYVPDFPSDSPSPVLIHVLYPREMASVLLILDGFSGAWAEKWTGNQVFCLLETPF